MEKLTIALNNKGVMRRQANPRYSSIVEGQPNKVMSILNMTVVGKIKNGCVFFAAGVQTNGFSQFNVDSICLPMFPHCGSFSIGPCRPLPYAKLSGTNPEIGTCRGNFSINRLLVELLIARSLTDSHGNSCLMTVAYSILSRIQQAMSFFVRSAEASEGLYLRHSEKDKRLTQLKWIYKDSLSKMSIQKPQHFISYSCHTANNLSASENLHT